MKGCHAVWSFKAKLCLSVLNRRHGECGAILRDAGKRNSLERKRKGWITCSHHGKANLTSQMAALHRGIHCHVPYTVQSTQEIKQPKYKTLCNFAVLTENHVSDPSCKIYQLGPHKLFSRREHWKHVKLLWENTEEKEQKWYLKMVF